jgi:hypothetical protein
MIYNNCLHVRDRQGANFDGFVGTRELSGVSKS